MRNKNVEKKKKSTFKEIKEKYPDKWVLLGDCEFDNKMRLKKGILLFVDKKRERVYRELKEFVKKYKNLVIRYTGEIPKDLKVLLTFKNVYFNPELNLIILDAFLHGKGKYKMGISLALDTGATITTISWEILEAIGYSPSLSRKRAKFITGSGVEYAPLVNVEGISIGNIFVGPLEVYAHTFPEESYIDGVIGLNFLKSLYYCIDYWKGIIKFKAEKNREDKHWSGK